MKTVFILNHVRDTQLCLNILEVLNYEIDVVITSFIARSEYPITGHKIFEPCMTEKDIVDFVNVINSLKLKKVSLHLCKDTPSFLNLMKNYDRAISRGRAFIIFKPFVKKAIALSMNRTYLDRLIDVLPVWKGNLDIVLSSKAWIDKEICKGHLSITSDRYSIIKNKSENFKFFDFSHMNKQKLDSIGLTEIKKELEIPLDVKIAVISPRNEICEPLSLYKGHDNLFVKNTIDQVVQLKKEGYYIVSRSRMDPKTKRIFSQKGRNSLSVDLINALHERNLVDKVVDDNLGHPAKVWKVIYCADVVMVSDNTSLCNVESVALEKPVIMPYNETIKKNIENLNPPIREMFKYEILFKSLQDVDTENFNSCIIEFKNIWFKKYTDQLS